MRSERLIRRRMRRFLAGLMGSALFTCVSSAPAQTIRVTVRLLLLSEPSSVDDTMDLTALGTAITDPGQMIPGARVYLEAWCQTIEPNGIATAAVDLAYNTDGLNTTEPQVVLAGRWMDVFPNRGVDDSVGLVNDLGGITFQGAGIDSHWAKIGTTEFDVTATPDLGITFCSLFAGPGLRFGIVGKGAVPPEEVDYGCLTLLRGNCNGDNEVGLTDYQQFATCMTGPEGGVSTGCDCADAENDGVDVDLADFAVVQRVFGGIQ